MLEFIYIYSALFLANTYGKNTHGCGALADVREDQVGQLFFRVAVGFQDDIIVPGIVTAHTCIALYIVLAGLINAVHHLHRFQLRKALLSHNPIDAIVLRCRDEYIQRVRVVLEHKETGAAGNDAGPHLGKAFENFHFGFENIVRGNMGPKFMDILGVQSEGLCWGHGRNLVKEIREPTLLLAFEILNGASGEVELLLEGHQQLFVQILHMLFFRKDASHGVAARADFAAEGDNERFFCVHVYRLSKGVSR